MLQSIPRADPVPFAAAPGADDLERAQERDLQRMLAKAQIARMLSRSLLFSLSRQHLDLPLDELKCLRLAPIRRTGMEDHAFLRLTQAGAAQGSGSEPFLALQTAFAACREPGRYRLIYLVSSDGPKKRVFLGAVSHHRDNYPPEDMVSVLRRTLTGNWPGTRFCDGGTEDLGCQAEIAAILKEMRHGVALTGIPSSKQGDQTSCPQTTARLLRSLDDMPFTYLVIADPIPDAAVSDMIDRCRDLLGQVHLLTRSTLTENLANSIAETTEHGESTEEAHSHTVTRDAAREAGQPAGGEASKWHDALDVGLDVGSDVLFLLTPFWPPALALSCIASLARDAVNVQDKPEVETPAPFLPEYDTTTTSRRLSSSRSIGLTRSAATLWGQEHLNAHAEEAENRIRRTIARLEQARNLGCWNVGVYMLGKTAEDARQGAMLLRALMSGEESGSEPVRVHGLRNVWRDSRQEGNQPVEGVRSLLGRFELPRLEISVPGSESPAGSLSSPLGTAFDSLSTPLGTRELTQLINLPESLDGECL